MWWIFGFITGAGVAILAGAMIRFGMSQKDHDEDYMQGDDYTDWGDKP